MSTHSAEVTPPVVLFKSSWRLPVVLSKTKRNTASVSPPEGRQNLRGEEAEVTSKVRLPEPLLVVSACCSDLELRWRC